MNPLMCPACGCGLDSRSDQTQCPQCQTAYRVQALCPTCQQELERLKACGAVDYFCNHCNTLVSKRAVQFALTPLAS
ncbi:zinc ribbon domain-containing protein [Aeromonas veronii]|uniref:zinc ribbon domain-containing protein n=1 Tax=Aeromonas TaxID=642 RepID=UPI0032EEB1C3